MHKYTTFHLGSVYELCIASLRIRTTTTRPQPYAGIISRACSWPTEWHDYCFATADGASPDLSRWCTTTRRRIPFIVSYARSVIVYVHIPIPFVFFSTHRARLETTCYITRIQTGNVVVSLPIAVTAAHRNKINRTSRVVLLLLLLLLLYRIVSNIYKKII
jgi:hypothetical protein